jgi:hypothetical protein
VHDDIGLGGWFVWATYALSAAILLAAIAVLVSALRRPASDFGPLGRGPWLIGQGGFIVLSVVGFAAGLLGLSGSLGPVFLTGLRLLVPVVVGQQVAYLLRVVYPSPQRRAARQGSASDEQVPSA